VPAPAGGRLQRSTPPPQARQPRAPLAIALQPALATLDRALSDPRVTAGAGTHAPPARWQPQNLACERHRVQGALQANELARQQADTHRQLAAASDHIAESLTRSVFWSQMVAAGLAIWLLG
jgi:hypothetical protein